ncbi:MAG: 2,3-bisphosphoglycerate-independent phosphoglycerate mutase [Endomicrobia bacterium]|nr:2,3-bisphosphoglycerate-independent phosphoglycerate mutase [Endomicrobiia bacterium]
MEDNLELLKTLTLKNEKKIIFLVIDGLGGATEPSTRKTELEVAVHPNLDKLASESLCGLAVPVDFGITPGSGPGHLSLFGYDPVKYLIGRGVLEVLGLGMELTENDLAFRGNFATIDSNGIITDRRAGRIPTEETVRLVGKIQKNISRIDNVEILLKPGKEHRFAGVFRHPDLVENITENDPHKEGNKPHKIQPTVDTVQAKFTTEVVNKFIEEVARLLKDEPKANYVLLRGFAKFPNMPKMQEVYKLTPAAIAVYPMYKGLAQVVGMQVIHGCETIQDEVNKLKELFTQPYDFYYLHIKDTDKLGEDGNFDGKVKKIEEIDKIIPEILSLQPDVLVVTGDHSTPAVNKGHSWHPVPVALWSKNPPTPRNNVKMFTEQEFSRGMLGIVHMTKILPLAMAYAGKLDKYGA